MLGIMESSEKELDLSWIPENMENLGIEQSIKQYKRMTSQVEWRVLWGEDKAGMVTCNQNDRKRKETLPQFYNLAAMEHWAW